MQNSPRKLKKDLASIKTGDRLRIRTPKETLEFTVIDIYLSDRLAKVKYKDMYNNVVSKRLLSKDYNGGRVKVQIIKSSESSTKFVKQMIIK